MSDEESRLQMEFVEEFKQFEQAGKTVRLRLTPLTAWCVMAAIQLANRHPEAQGTPMQIARKVARKIEEQIAVTPAMKAVAEKGWEQAGKTS